VVNRHASSARPTDPAQALAGISSSAWSPDPDVGLSPDSRDTYTQALFAPAAASRSGGGVRRTARRTWPRGAWWWAGLGGLTAATAFSLVLVLARPRPTAALARGAAVVPVALAARGGSGKAAATAPAASRPSVPTRTVDLFPYVDPARDTIAGNWRIEGGALMSDASHRARMGIRYPVPREYDFRVQFTQVDGDNCVAQLFTAGNPAALILGGWKRTVSGFQQIAGKWANVNATGVRGLKFENGRMHTSVVRVRTDSIEAWLDGERITAYATDGSDLSNRDWEPRGYPLGVGSEVSSTIFHKIELVEYGKPGSAAAH
jgi:hypothetical protein